MRTWVDKVLDGLCNIVCLLVGCLCGLYSVVYDSNDKLISMIQSDPYLCYKAVVFLYLIWFVPYMIYWFYKRKMRKKEL